MLKKVEITKYDKSIKKPPFLTLHLDDCEVDEPDKDVDKYGEKFADNLWRACRNKGYYFKFYTMSSKLGYDYEAVVYEPGEY